MKYILLIYFLICFLISESTQSEIPTGIPTGYPTGYPSRYPTISPTSSDLLGYVLCEFYKLSGNVCSNRLFIKQCRGSISYNTHVTCDSNGISTGLTFDGLSGSLPEDLAGLTVLKSLKITDSKLSGTIPSSVGNLTGLTSLILSNDDLMGTLPTYFGSLAKLTHLDLSSNELSGSIPAYISTFENLIDINLSNNYFTGTIPSSLSQLGNLESLILSNNLFTGLVPSSLCNLAHLTHITTVGNSNLSCYASCLSTVTNHHFGGISICSSSSSSSSPTPIPTPSPITYTEDCISLLLFNPSGGGWDTGTLSVYSSNGDYEHITADCDTYKTSAQYCFNSGDNSDGDFVIFEITGFMPQHPWEILWMAYNSYDGGVYIGSYKTSLTFQYEINSALSIASVSLVSSSNIIPETNLTCSTCINTNSQAASTAGGNAAASPPRMTPPPPKKIKPSPSPPTSFPTYYTKKNNVAVSGPKTGPLASSKTRPISSSSSSSSQSNSVASSSSSVKPGSAASFFTMPNYKSTTTLTSFKSQSPPKSSSISSTSSTSSTSDLSHSHFTSSPKSSTTTSTTTAASFSSSSSSKSTSHGSSSGSSRSSNSNSGVSTDHYTTPPRILKSTRGSLSYELLGNWYESFYDLANFYISDSDQQTLLYSGSTCSSSIGSSDTESATCAISLVDGSYVWRVTGAFYSNSAEVGWQFCGHSGGVAMEMTFTVKSGECIAGILSNITCSSTTSQGTSAMTTTAQKVLVLGGTVELAGLTLSSGTLTTQEETVLLQALHQEILDARFADIVQDSSAIISYETISVEDSSSLSSSRLLLETNHGLTQRIGFSITILTSKSLEDETSVTRLTSYFTKSLSSGVFLARIHHAALRNKLEGLRSVTRVSLVELRVLHEARENSIASYVLSASIVGSALMGLLFAAMLVSYIYRRNSGSSRVVARQGYVRALNTSQLDESEGGLNVSTSSTSSAYPLSR